VNFDLVEAVIVSPSVVSTNRPIATRDCSYQQPFVHQVTSLLILKSPFYFLDHLTRKWVPKRICLDDLFAVDDDTQFTDSPANDLRFDVRLSVQLGGHTGSYHLFDRSYNTISDLYGFHIYTSCVVDAYFIRCCRQ
jgi:hypothetical protein